MKRWGNARQELWEEWPNILLALVSLVAVLAVVFVFAHR